MNHYVCLSTQQFKSASYEIVPLREADLLLIKEWRNQQIEVLRQRVTLTDEMQKSYYDTIIKPSFEQQQPQQILFSYLDGGKCIGYGGIVHIDWYSRRGEVSFLLDPTRAANPIQYQKDFGVYLSLIKTVAFKDLHFHRLFTETFDIRPIHVATLEANGFILEGRLKDHMFTKAGFVDSLMHGCINHD